MDGGERPFVYWAARIDGREGWAIGTAAGDEDAARVALAATGRRVLDVRTLAAGRGRPPAFSVGAGEHGAASHHAVCANWAYDPAADCWRAPGETISPPPGDPAWCDGVAAAFSEPKFGWIDWSVAASGREATVWFSHLADPVPALLRFLEALAAGGCPRLSVDQENAVAQWHALPPPAGGGRPALPGRARLVLSGARSLRGGGTALDIVVPRRAFAAEVYRAWTAGLLRHRRAFEAEWFSYFRPEAPPGADPAAAATERDFERVRSAVLDGLLRESGAGEAGA